MKAPARGHVEIHHGDAAAFAVPDDANVFFFFNPFGGRNDFSVSGSAHPGIMDIAPSDLFVIYFNHGRFDECVATQPWLRKVHETSFCGFYRLASAL